MAYLNSKILIIRADANERIGIGHVMRCIALGQTWRDRGGKVIFFSNTGSEYIKKLIRSEGFNLYLIQNSDYVGNQFLDRLAHLCKNTHGGDSAWIVIDGYHFHTEFQSKILDAGYRLMVVDDYHHLSNYRASIILNQNIEAEQFNYKCNRDAILLLGTKFALIRKQYLKQKRKKGKTPEIAKRILVTLGGADPNNTTQKVVQALTLFKHLDLNLKIVVGPSNPNIDQIKKQLSSCSLKIEILSSVSDMPSTMAWADFAISSAGSTCWELAYLGVPFTTIVLAENQKMVAAGLENADIASNLGTHETLTVDSIVIHLNKILPNDRQRKCLSDNGLRQVDGMGCDRVLEKIVPLDLLLRKAKREDCMTIWKWSNEPLTRSASFNSEYIQWENHKEWFLSKLNNPSHRYYIAQLRTGDTVGHARFEITGNIAVISVSCDKKYRGYGIGSKLIRIASKKIVDENSIGLIQAYIKKGNIRSIRAFEQAGFIKANDIDYKGIPSIIMELKGNHERNENV